MGVGRSVVAIFESAICRDVYGMHIYYSIESIFVATVCLAYLPLCIWELFRKILICGHKINEIAYSNSCDEKNKC